MTLTEQLLSQLPGDALGGLRQADQRWRSLREGTLPVPEVVTVDPQPGEAPAWDVIVAGGTLGIFLGAALAQRGWRVALIERGTLRGRDQEWNISRHELQVLLDLELLTPEELEQAIATEYNPARVSFLGGPDLWVENVLNVGVDPVFLLETLKARFLAAGGHLLEQTPVQRVTVHPNGVAVSTGESGSVLTARLLLDGMGHFSPIVQQARQGQKPDGVCLVVGTCAQGYPANETGDLLVSFTPIAGQCQYFWEAFPARDGRTTYLFTYVDAHPERPSLEALFEDYFRLLPEYQQVDLAALSIQRSLFGFFPCYRQSPLRSPWDRILQIGDSSGSQSPLSFGGFGSLLRHLQRLTDGIGEALTADVLDRRGLALLQPYQPNLSVTWLFQRTMSVGVQQQIAPNQINQLLVSVFDSMAALGDPVLKPFLQDVVRFPALSLALMRTSLTAPARVVEVIPQVGLPSLVDWMSHYSRLALYTGLYPVGRAIEPWTRSLSPAQRYYYHRWLQAWQYGSGADYSPLA